MFNKSFKKSFHKMPVFVKPLKSRREAGLKPTIWKHSKLFFLIYTIL